MKRRDMLRNLGLGAAAAVVVPKVALADDGTCMPKPDEAVLFEVKISRNHGHELPLSIRQVVELIQTTDIQDTVSLNIQGQSNHAHSVMFEQAQLFELLAMGELVLNSSEDFGHSHKVTVTLVLPPAS